MKQYATNPNKNISKFGTFNDFKKNIVKICIKPAVIVFLIEGFIMLYLFKIVYHQLEMLSFLLFDLNYQMV